jgi:hypothetical protein
VTTPTFAGLKIKDADGNEKIDLGFRLQFLGISSDRDLNGDGEWDRYEDFRIRRGRLRLKGTLTPKVGVFLQSDVSGVGMILIDAYVTLRHETWLQAFAGQMLAPSSRQTITSSGALMAADRPNITYKSLSWGLRILNAFATVTSTDADIGVRGAAQVRDTGVTVYGIPRLGENFYVKYYAGVYDGISAPQTNDQRLTGRVQLNYEDSEGSYYDSSTYLGKKKTISLGASIDHQPDAGALVDTTVYKDDYTFYNVDVFAEQPVGKGSITVEAAYYNLNYDIAPRVEGDGFYVQAGYYIKKWQPWALYEMWKSEATDDRGSFDSYRVGLSYFIDGQRANVKVGYERINSDTTIGSTSETALNTFLIGFYTTY